MNHSATARTRRVRHFSLLGVGVLATAALVIAVSPQSPISASAAGPDGGPFAPASARVDSATTSAVMAAQVRAASRAGEKAGRVAGRKAGKKASSRAWVRSGKAAAARAGKKAGRAAGERAGKRAGAKVSAIVGKKAGKVAGRHAGRQAGRNAARPPEKFASKGFNHWYARMYMAAKYGWGKAQYRCLLPMWGKESAWNEKAHNSGSGAHGIPQSMPGSKMAAYGPDWRTNPVVQIKWGMNYIKSAYGSPCRAWSFWRSHHWY
jgi:hypothetical protein